MSDRRAAPRLPRIVHQLQLHLLLRDRTHRLPVDRHNLAGFRAVLGWQKWTVRNFNFIRSVLCQGALESNFVIIAFLLFFHVAFNTSNSKFTAHFLLLLHHSG